MSESATFDRDRIFSLDSPLVDHFEESRRLFRRPGQDSEKLNSLDSDFDFDPFDERFFGDPYPYYSILRERAPAYRRPTAEGRVWPHYWMISRAQDVNDALADWQTFSSARGTLIDTDISLIPINMFNMDPPRHDEHREILARVLTPKRVAALEPHLREMSAGILDGLLDSGSFDAAKDYAQLIPTLTMCELLDLPTSDREQFLKWNLDTLAGSDFTSEGALAAYAEMADYWKDLVVERRKHRSEDLISQILHSQTEGQELSDEEVAGFCSLLHDGSQNTTMNTIANGIISFSRCPDQRQKLVSAPERWPRAVDEVLRFISPVQGLARVTTRDVDIGDETIPEGDQVLLLYGSANHDPSVFDRPEELDVDRDVKSHWTFGNGIHFCLGNAVARLETRIALETLFERIPEYEVEETSIVRNQLVPTRGIGQARVVF
ncbi:MAG: cytochrome P450 [bacterium]|nr:cytochrome P450 [bacterium]